MFRPVGVQILDWKTIVTKQISYLLSPMLNVSIVDLSHCFCPTCPHRPSALRGWSLEQLTPLEQATWCRALFCRFFLLDDRLPHGSCMHPGPDAASLEASLNRIGCIQWLHPGHIPSTLTPELV